MKVVPKDLEIIHQLKQNEGTDIYLCGGGTFAGWLLENGLIDILKIKSNPFIQGEGIPLFGESKKQVQMTLTDRVGYPDGLQILTYNLNY